MGEKPDDVGEGDPACVVDHGLVNEDIRLPSDRFSDGRIVQVEIEIPERAHRNGSIVKRIKVSWGL